MLDEASAPLTVAETARYLQRSTEQVRRYLREGVLPGRRLGGQWFIARADAEAFRLRRNEPEQRPHLAAADPDPLSAAIAIGGSGGADISVGRVGYLCALIGVAAHER